MKRSCGKQHTTVWRAAGVAISSQFSTVTDPPLPSGSSSSTQVREVHGEDPAAPQAPGCCGIHETPPVWLVMEKKAERAATRHATRPTKSGQQQERQPAGPIILSMCVFAVDRPSVGARRGLVQPSGCKRLHDYQGTTRLKPQTHHWPGTGAGSWPVPAAHNFALWVGSNI